MTVSKRRAEPPIEPVLSRGTAVGNPGDKEDVEAAASRPAAGRKAPSKNSVILKGDDGEEILRY